jgi:hypothetical protein
MVKIFNYWKEVLHSQHSPVGPPVAEVYVRKLGDRTIRRRTIRRGQFVADNSLQTIRRNNLIQL